jgi:hypothetical protein
LADFFSANIFHGSFSFTETGTIGESFIVPPGPPNDNVDAKENGFVGNGGGSAVGANDRKEVGAPLWSPNERDSVDLYDPTSGLSR